mmetsp:Transcript_79101/g.173437  ORF Transcript_79101/g.173437 Transcript_79101/m.173437 type:complete len:269 (-) Transcript_79101:1823-2629(-)
MANGDINALGVTVIVLFFAIVAFLLLGALLFQQRRSKALSLLGRNFGKPLEFQSPDDAPRTFVQYGYMTSRIGQVLLHSWGVLFAVGYIYMVLFTWLSYSPKFQAPPFGLEIFGSWDGLLAPWLLVFTSIHIIGIFLVLMWPAMRSGFMMPMNDLGMATHIVIEEDVPFDTDATMVDPDDFRSGFRHRLRQSAAKAGKRLSRAKCRTVKLFRRALAHKRSAKAKVERGKRLLLRPPVRMQLPQTSRNKALALRSTFITISTARAIVVA